ncbi:septal ring lytic transglycosylase RlpA family protein [Arcobacter sp. HD9-500m-PIT-SAG03]|nr:septal ring lytic transglycosylase RlpA family protein [Arcobacter sp. HD9-500m-PIT-SAG03]
MVLFFGFYLIGCSSKSYDTSSWSSGSNSTRMYKKIPKEKIRNSKAMHRATMRSYVISGKRYYPTLAKVDDKFKGIASWYGPNFHAKKTSNGEVYDMYAMTAAHKTLPMNTMVKVDNLENGKSIIVRINDRGPFVTGRIIDLSNKAAHKVDMVKKGTARVKLTVLGFDAKIARTTEEKQETATVGKYYVQVGAFRRYAGAKITQSKFKMILENNYDVVIKKGYFKSAPINRVWISGFRSEEEAKDFKASNDLAGSMIIAE